MEPLPDVPPLKPEKRHSWPGIGATPAAGFEVDTDKLRSVAEGLISDAGIAVATLPRKHQKKPLLESVMNIGNWQAAEALEKLHTSTARDLSYLAADTILECVVAANLIVTAGGNYDIADDPRWVKDTSLWSQSNDDEFLRGSWDSESKIYHVSSYYPDGNVHTYYISAITSIENDTYHMNNDREGIRETLASANPGPMEDHADSTGKIAIALGELAEIMVSRARDLSGAWLGPAADQAQTALKMIYESLQPLSKAYNTISLLARDAAEILREAPRRFDAMVPTLSGVSDVFSDSDDDAARLFMTNLNTSVESGLLGVAHFHPQQIITKLPGLISNRRAEPYFFS